MPVALIAAGVGAVGAIGGAAISASAANNATNAASSAAAQNNALESQIYNSNKSLETPFINAGDAANTELQGFLGLGGSPAASQAALNTYLNSTGYQFAKTQGLDAVTNNKAATGLLGSGSTLKALDAYGTGLANQYSQQYVGNLQGEVGTGASAANALAGEGENYGSAVSGNNNSAATVSANAGLASASQINSAVDNAFKAYGQFSGSGATSSTNGSSFLSGSTSPGNNYSSSYLAPNAFAYDGVGG